MAKKEEEAEGKEAGHEEAPKGKSKKKLIIIIVAAVVVLGGGAFFMMGGKKADTKETEHKEEEKHYVSAQLDPFIVNLSESSAFLKTTLLVEYDPALLTSGEGGEGGGGAEGGHGAGEGEKKAGLPPVMKAREPMIRDAVIRVLSSKKTADVLIPEGKENLKQELVEAINEAIGLPEGPVVAIYFTEFIIQ